MIQSGTLIQQGSRTFVRIARTRRFGSVFPPLRRAYLLVMPSILVATGLFCFAAETDFAFITGAVVLGGVAIYLLLDLLGRRQPLRVSTVFASTFGLAYGVGSANTWFTLPRGDETLGDFLHISTPQLTYAMASILGVIALLLALGELYETPIFGEDFELEFNNRSVVFLTLGTGLLAGAYATGSISFMGGGNELGHVSAITSLAVWLASPLLAFAVCVALNVKGRFTRNYARVLSAVLFAMIFPFGRRVLFFSIVLAIVGLRLGRYRIPFSPLKKTVLLGLLATVLYFTSIGFFYLRIAGYSLVRPTLVQRVSAALQLAKDKSYSEIKQSFAENVQRRTFVLGFLAQIEDYSRTMPTGHGHDLAEQLQLGLPSLLFAEKDLYYTEEAYTDELFGTSYTDEANSIFSAGAVDFGLWGVFFYPLMVVVVFRVFFEVIAETAPVFASCFIILASFSEILEPENTATAYIVVIRNGILFGFLVWFIMSLPEFRVKNVGL